MNLESLKHHKPRICDYIDYKEYAVLIPITDYMGRKCIALQVRSESLQKQPSEICFPGGKIEPGESSLEAAVRETCEELLVNKESIEVLGELDTLVTPFNSIIYPFAAKLHNYEGTFSKDEVQEIFYIPIDFLLSYKPICSFMDVAIQPQEDFPFEKVQKGEAYPWAKGKYPVYFYEYEDKVVWGITARILKNFVELISR